jgi:catechol 2,3-dioxygenase
MAGERPIKGLGEIALRVENLEAMERFYRDIVGLGPMEGGRSPHAVFFRIAEGVGGHTQVLALFDRRATKGYRGLSRELTTVDHIAFEVCLENFAAEKARLEKLGVQLETAEHLWVRWRSLYFHDPEGNEIEFVCYDDAVHEDTQRKRYD